MRCASWLPCCQSDAFERCLDALPCVFCDCLCCVVVLVVVAFAIVIFVAAAAATAAAAAAPAMCLLVSHHLSLCWSWSILLHVQYCWYDFQCHQVTVVVIVTTACHPYDQVCLLCPIISVWGALGCNCGKKMGDVEEYQCILVAPRLLYTVWGCHMACPSARL